jgi:hypothetical protein
LSISENSQYKNIQNMEKVLRAKEQEVGKWDRRRTTERLLIPPQLIWINNCRKLDLLNCGVFVISTTGWDFESKTKQKNVCLLSNDWEGWIQQLSPCTTIVGSAFCDHGFQLSVAYCYQAA